MGAYPFPKRPHLLFYAQLRDVLCRMGDVILVREIETTVLHEVGEQRDVFFLLFFLFIF